MESAESWVDDHINMGWTRADAVLGLKERDAAVRRAAIRECADEVYTWGCMTGVKESMRDRILALLEKP